jgi:PilZ domain
MEPKQTDSVGVRRSGRISKEIPILLSGSDTDGRAFSERTKTLLLSKHGASLLSHHKLIPEQEIFLTSLSNDREINVRVCGKIGEREDGHIYGVAFVDPHVDFWGMEFPPAEKLAKSLTRMTLECTGCKERIAVDFDAMELDVYMVNDGVLRYCKRCLTSTVWKRATGDAAPAKPEPLAEPKQEAQPAPVPEAPASPPTPAVIPNRRRDRRAKMKCSACIRSWGASEEVVECMDMSRGGFSFRSSRRYSEEAMIEAAIPYTPGGTSIFVPAQIANVRELQKGKLFRYGAAYVRGPI